MLTQVLINRRRIILLGHADNPVLDLLRTGYVQFFFRQVVLVAQTLNLFSKFLNAFQFLFMGNTQGFQFLDFLLVLFNLLINIEIENAHGITSWVNINNMASPVIAK